MSKKNFKGIDSLLNSPEPLGIKEKPGRKKSENTNEIRATYILKPGQPDKLKAIAYWERLEIKDIVQTMIDDYLERYEKKNGPIKPIPERKK